MNSPLISVVVPVYNVEKYLDKCINSIINQTYSNLEIILVDDGSTDKCNLLCDEWRTKDDRIKVIHQKNRGLSGARNSGIEIAKGQYICFVDSDDYISPIMYEKLLGEMERTKSDIVCCKYIKQYEYEKSKLDETLDQVKTSVFDNEEGLKYLLTNPKYDVYAWNKLYQKELFDEVRYPLGLTYEDIATVSDLFLRAKRVAFVDADLYSYLRRDDSITASSAILKGCYRQSDWDFITAAELLYKNVAENMPDVLHQAEYKYFMALIGTFVKMVFTKDCDKNAYNELYIRIMNHFDEMMKCEYFSYLHKIAIYSLKVSPILFKFIVRIKIRIFGW